MACAAIDELPEPPTAADAVQAALGVQPREHRRRAAPHGVDRGAAVAGAHELGVVGAARARDLLARRRRARPAARRARRRRRAATSTPRLAQAVAQEARTRRPWCPACRRGRRGGHSAALHAEVAALQLGVADQLARRSSRPRSARPPSRAGARPSPWPWRGSARRRGSPGPRRRGRGRSRSSVSMIVGASPSEGSSMISSLRVAQQRAADREHLLLAAGELHAAVLAALGQAREELVDGVGRPAVARRAAARPSAGARRRSATRTAAGPAGRSRSRRRRSCRTGARRSRCPRRRSSPLACAGGICMIALHSVVLPMPLRPMSATGSSAISKLTSCSTWARP